MFQRLISQAEIAAQEAKHRQDPRNYVMIRKRLNQIIECDGVYFFGRRVMGTSSADCFLNVYIEMSTFILKH